MTQKAIAIEIGIIRVSGVHFTKLYGTKNKQNSQSQIVYRHCLHFIQQR